MTHDRRGKPLPDQLVRQIRRLKREGMSFREIARVTGVARSTIEIHIWSDPAFVPAEADQNLEGRVHPSTFPDDGVLTDPTEVFEQDDLDSEASDWPDGVDEQPDEYQFDEPS